MDIFIALIPALCWGNIGLVSGIMGGSPKEQTIGMTWGAFILSVCLTLLFRNNYLAHCTAELWITGLLMGFFWCAGQFLQFTTLKAIGISKGYPLSTGGQLILNAISGAFIFSEWKTGMQLSFGCTAVVLLTSGAALTAFKEKSKISESSSSSTVSENWKIGIPALIFSTIFYCLYTTISTWRCLDTKALLLPQSVGMVTGALIFGLRRGSITKHTFRNMFTGVLFSVGNFFLLISISRIGLAISFSLSQVGVILSTFGAIFILKESKTKKELCFVIIGILLILSGAFLLGMIKNAA